MKQRGILFGYFESFPEKYNCKRKSFCFGNGEKEPTHDFHYQTIGLFFVIQQQKIQALENPKGKKHNVISIQSICVWCFSPKGKLFVAHPVVNKSTVLVIEV